MAHDKKDVYVLYFQLYFLCKTLRSLLLSTIRSHSSYNAMESTRTFERNNSDPAEFRPSYTYSGSFELTPHHLVNNLPSDLSLGHTNSLYHQIVDSQSIMQQNVKMFQEQQEVVNAAASPHVISAAAISAENAGVGQYLLTDAASEFANSLTGSQMPGFFQPETVTPSPEYFTREYLQHHQHALPASATPSAMSNCLQDSSVHPKLKSSVFSSRPYRPTLDTVAERAKMRLQDAMVQSHETVIVNPIINVQELTGYTGGCTAASLRWSSVR